MFKTPIPKPLYDVIVIGGGASGMMAAGRAAERGRKVLLLEKNKYLGEKLKITGGGRCNITNAEENERILLSHYDTMARFLYSPFSQFGMRDTFSFFESRGLPLVVEGQKRAFPKTQKAIDVFAVLEAYLKKGKVKVQINTPVRDIVSTEGRIEKIIARGKEYSAHSYILATGGKSHAETGSTGDGFGWLKDLGLRVHEPTPTIVPLSVRESWIKSLAGVSLKHIKISFYVRDTKAFSLKGDILCTHFGLSGPLILNAAGKVADLLHQGDVTARIDVFPDLDLGALDKHLTTTFDRNKNKTLKNIVKEITPPGTGAAILKLLPTIDPNIKIHDLTKERRKELGGLLKALPVTITGLMGYDRAVVADGGVALAEVDMRTMAVKKYSNLYIIGDLLHVSRPSGGYSLQLCWTTGYLSGSSA